jgi:hypothetical protein
MATPGVLLEGFAYGEHLEGAEPRSLGYRLLAPAHPAPWTAEVEALARRLQAAPYPDHWPPADLFCSVLLADGRRLVAVARYGLADHTVSRRRGGLELIGVVGPGNLDVPSALAVARWLRQRRAEATDLHSLGGSTPLADVLAAVPPAPAAAEPVPVLPIRLWQEGALLFAATAPRDPDHRLGLLEQGADGNWQWLPYVGADFPLQQYAQRGPVVAWTPHLAGVAVKLDHKPAEGPPRPHSRRPTLSLGLVLLLLTLLAANLWALRALHERVGAPGQPVAEPNARPQPAAPAQSAADEGSREELAQALQRWLRSQRAVPGWSQAELQEQYQRLAAEDGRLRVQSPEARAGLGAVALLARRNPERVEALVREALAHKGYDTELINLVCRRVREAFARADREAP